MEPITPQLSRKTSSRPSYWARYFFRLMAAEISSMVRYYDQVIQVAPEATDHGDLLEAVDCPNRSQVGRADELPDQPSDSTKRIAVLLNGNFNMSLDIQQEFRQLFLHLSRNSRVVVVVYTSYHRWLFRWGARLGLVRADRMTTFLTTASLKQMAALEGFELVRMRGVCWCPVSLLRVGDLINMWMPLVPLLRHFPLASMIVFRPRMPCQRKPSLSIVIPARNEAENIRRAIAETPQMEGVDTEILFVEGHSTDSTWQEIQKVVKEGHEFFTLSAFQQTGHGKCDAVRLGFAKATKDLYAILDADLTMPPNYLSRFYQAYVDGHADFVNGSRLAYPMEHDAMRFLNFLGNLFFAKILSLLLGMSIGDSLCGTKLVSGHDYRRFRRWRDDFGDFDPFGDFELLFPAAVMALGSIDIAVRYRARTYGSTNISRFSHGLVLLRMTLVGLFRICLGRTR